LTRPKEYTIVIHSKSRFYSFLLLSSAAISPLGILASEMIDHVAFQSVALFSFLVICYFFARWISKGSARIVMTDKTISHYWTKRFWFSKDADLTFSWKEVKSFGHSSDRFFDRLELNLSNRTRYQIQRLGFGRKTDDFNRLMEELPTLICEIDARILDNAHNRYLDTKDPLPRKILMRFMVLVGLLFLFMLISKVFIPDSKMNWTGICVTGSMILAYLIYLKFSHHKVN
jgi:hypothetical protein